MNKFRQILHQGLLSASEGNLKDALDKFEEGLNLRPTRADEQWVGLLHRNAALIHEQNGDLKTAKRYYLNALKYLKADPYTYFSLGQISERLFQMTAARKYFSMSHKLAVQTQDEDLLTMLRRRGYSADRGDEEKGG
jgi:tetratricopeptide (TPR) repeat protein